ncbi:hypothetical protein SAMD00019534_016060 [Acytostelium subglobosum LB1]|uniref:hypothetical protein n=1 Tax=Acytostelium subglobosum LB1 TaxID=1410327 RepID=UPI000644EF4C|nr:hypothetical protein SAMD00019534_016060 [Acytostelium subglobosum LB1]GAM18431.1 hypothetical protein SAMD00019534_016060 [Acytostelium subglobosum LB1]|eukprot:XP_012757651.1 hypothetical protein SAMD00019534_016060 [Acytostelium subglobosum LB1]
MSEQDDKDVSKTSTTTTTTSTITSVSTTSTTTTLSNEQKDQTKKRKKRADDEIISIQDALEDQEHEEEELYEEALDQYQQDWGDEDSCTFDQGYITQPVYACKDCPGTFGMCYGCSMHCHLDHNIIELFKKRSFRCDCGTKRVGNVKCSLQDKVGAENNADNAYNHNFAGTYCYCKMPYNFEEDMVQCLFCYDWFHETCIKLNSNLETPDLDDMSDFICGDCVNKNQFLVNYPSIRLLADETTETPKESSTTTTPPTITTTTTTTTTGDDKTSTCKWNKELRGLSCDLFCRDGWRDQLCRCEQCIKHYTDQKCLFVLEKPSAEDDEQDEEEIKQKREQKKPTNPFSNDNPMNVFSTLVPPTQQTAMLQAYGQMKDRLTALFSAKKQTDQVITKDDIKSIFNELTNKRLRR